MLLAGSLLGFFTALCQSSSYVFSRLYVLRRNGSVLGLLVLAHVIMGIISFTLIPLASPPWLPPFWDYAFELAGVAGFYLVGQIALFTALRRVEGSRVSPLLGLKIVILAAINSIFLSHTLDFQQWLAVGLAVAAAFALATAGGRLPYRAGLNILISCMGYSFSDLSIRAMVDVMVANQTDTLFIRLHASVAGMCLAYVVCGLVAVVVMLGLSIQNNGARRVLKDWRYALPFTASWYLSMIGLFGCFGTVGVVFGNILQSTRGVISLLLGALVAWLGHVHLESKQTRRTLLLRVLAAMLMTLAIALYVTSPTPVGK
jgi:uncharacterized membrane protein